MNNLNSILIEGKAIANHGRYFTLQSERHHRNGDVEFTQLTVYIPTHLASLEVGMECRVVGRLTSRIPNDPASLTVIAEHVDVKKPVYA